MTLSVLEMKCRNALAKTLCRSGNNGNVMILLCPKLWIFK